MVEKDGSLENLPACARQYINDVVRRIRYSRAVRREVRRELIDHFSDALGDGTGDQERQERAEQLIQQFGDAKLLGSLIRRGKKCCRPLWKKAIIRTGQFVFLCYLLVLPCNAWVMHTWNDKRVDYLKIFNDLNRPAAGEEENALPYYQRAVELYVEMPDDLEKAIRAYSGGSHKTTLTDYQSLNEKDKTALRQWLGDNDQAWQQVKAATEVEYYWRDIHGFLPDGADELLEPLSPLRALAKMGCWRAKQQATENDLGRALEDCLTIARIGKHLQASSILLEHMVGTAIATLGKRAILEIVANYTAERSCLANVQEQLEKLYSHGFPMLDTQGEAIYQMGSIQTIFNWAGANNRIDWVFPRQLLLRGSREATEQKVLRVFEELSKGSPYQWRSKDKAEAGFQLPITDMLLSMMRPSFKRVIEMDYRCKAEHQATVTILALQRWQLEKGQYPDNLEQLLAGGYIQALPEDPYSDGILKYDKRGDDFVLYSVGADFDDDGGVQKAHDHWDEKDGDRVFWPLNQDVAN